MASFYCPLLTHLLQTIENLQSLSNLTELWLGKNKISKLQGLESLVNLRVLSLQVGTRSNEFDFPHRLFQSNRIVALEGLATLTNLEEIYISHNGLLQLGGLSHNVREVDQTEAKILNGS